MALATVAEQQSYMAFPSCRNCCVCSRLGRLHLQLRRRRGANSADSELLIGEDVFAGALCRRRTSAAVDWQSTQCCNRSVVCCILGLYTAQPCQPCLSSADGKWFCNSRGTSLQCQWATFSETRSGSLAEAPHHTLSHTRVRLANRMTVRQLRCAGVLRRASNTGKPRTLFLTQKLGIQYAADVVRGRGASKKRAYYTVPGAFQTALFETVGPASLVRCSSQRVTHAYYGVPNDTAFECTDDHNA